MTAVIVTTLVLVGTVLQYRTAVLEINRTQQEAARVFRIVDDWKQEVPWWRVISWWRQRRAVRDVLRDDLKHAALYRHLLQVLAGWSLLTMAAAVAFVAAVSDLVRSSL